MEQYAIVEYEFQSHNFCELANNSLLQTEMHKSTQNTSSVELARSVLRTAADNLLQDNPGDCVNVCANAGTILLQNTVILCMWSYCFYLNSSMSKAGKELSSEGLRWQHQEQGLSSAASGRSIRP